MVEWIKNWVISICTAVIFITAVELIVPDNKMKRYVKFVMGLIMIAVIMNPIIKIADGSVSVTDYISKANTYVDSVYADKNTDKAKDEYRKNTISSFEKNLNDLCEKTLKEKFQNNDFKVNSEAYYDNSNSTMIIKGLSVDITSKGTLKIAKVQIGEDTANINSNNCSSLGNNVKDYLSSKLGIDKKIITISEKSNET
ncbi:MAG: stage III sporulation protein AF [Clostridium sp.]|nr:stage III sporulation protein AF [Clostridium sp.]